MGSPHFTLIRHDVEVPFNEPVDEIYNLACPASPPFYQRYPVKTLRTNVLGILNMLNLANTFKAKILQASTSEIYGDALVHPQHESYWGNVNPVGIRSCYDEGKRCAEAFLFDYNREYGTRVKVVRIFNTYGPRMSPEDGRVISNFILQALTGRDITIYGDGQQTRSFCYVDDLIEGMVRMMATEDDVTGPINLGNPSEKSILDIANIIFAAVGSQAKLVFSERPSDDPMQRCPDISSAEKLLDWIPMIDLKKGLSRTIEYFRDSLNG
jgi:UDP-glucuronate decarboxylase